MCLAVPGKIISINYSNPDLKMAMVNFGGITQDVCIQWLDDVKIGDYVLVHVGFALNKIDEKVSTTFPFNRFGDHIIVTVEYTGL